MINNPTLREALCTAIATLERNGDEWQICDHLRAALAQPDEPVAAPAGWALVPVEPTPEMIDAGDISDAMGYAADGMYAEMLAAAPQPATPSAPVTQEPSDDQIDSLIARTWGDTRIAPKSVRRFANAVLALRPVPQPRCSKFAIGQRVRKTKGSEWQGRVVGTYSTDLTPEGYAVESEAHAGSVQIYPASALELAGEKA